MTLKEAFRAQLIAATSVTDLIPATSIYSGYVPAEKTTNKYVIIRVISGSIPGTHEGSTRLNLGARIEVTCYAEKSAVADRIRLAIQLLMDSFRGTLGGSGGIKYTTNSVIGPRDIIDEKSGLVGSQVDFLGTYDASMES